MTTLHPATIQVRSTTSNVNSLSMKNEMLFLCFSSYEGQMQSEAKKRYIDLKNG